MFERIVRRHLRRHFRSVMTQNVERLQHANGPLIVYLNHASWWDPMVCILLARTLLPERSHYAPIDAESLKKYPILRKIGMFPVELASVRGAAEFLSRSQAILRSGGVLWLTPQGQFADVREPVHFKGGLAALAARLPDVSLVPLAMEYPFWNERLPEALVRFGEPFAVGVVDAAVTQFQAEEVLRVEMQELKKVSCARDANSFSVLLSGGRGIGSAYAIPMRLRALLTGRKFNPDHTQRPDSQTREHAARG